MLKRKLNKWQIHFVPSAKDFTRYPGSDPGWRHFDLAIIKITSFAPDGQHLSKGNYKGFWLKLRWWFPIEKR